MQKRPYSFRIAFPLEDPRKCRSSKDIGDAESNAHNANEWEYLDPRFSQITHQYKCRRSSYICKSSPSSQYAFFNDLTDIGISEFKVVSTDLSCTNSLCLHLLGLPDDLIWSSLDDTAGFGKLGANAHEVGVDVASGLATFIDAPTGLLATDTE